MVKRIHIVLLLMAASLTLLSISCLDENKSVMVDDSIVGVWALDEDLGITCVVKASDSYSEYVIEEAVKTQYKYFFQDTIQFMDNGRFLNGKFVADEVEDPKPDDVILTGNSFNTIKGVLEVIPPSQSSTSFKYAEYQIEGTHLFIHPVISDYFFTEEFIESLELSPEVRIDKITYTMYYKRIDKSN